MGMKILLAALIASLAASAPGRAMNWEGHDDWMIDHPAAMAFRAAVPEARPVRREPACGNEGNYGAPDNPYEQIPLPCRDRSPSGSSGKPADRKSLQ
jgi:hypothetical protein